MTKDWIKRAYRTFFQAFVGSALVLAQTVNFGSEAQVIKGALMTLLISSISAGISAVMNIKN